MIKRIVRVNILAILLALSVVLASACNKTPDANTAASNDTGTSTQTAQVYTCPMHPQVEQSEPGQCPICGMDLVLKQ